MQILSAIAAVSAEAEERAELFMPGWAFALIAAAFFLLVALVTYSYRDVSNRHSDRVGADTPDDHGHGTH